MTSSPTLPEPQGFLQIPKLAADGDTPAQEITPVLIRSQLERILSSPTFVRSRRLGRFLRFTLEQYIEGRQGALKEYLVGVEVFNKLESFDPRIDSIVRVEARRLRSKLDRYYKNEGFDDEIVIQFRKGSYVPIVMNREQYLRVSATLRPATEEADATRLMAVASFSSLSPDPAHQFFCSGLTDDLISALTKIPCLQIVARAASGAPAGQGRKAEYLLEGSVRQQGERLRISAQLIDLNKRIYLWSETYERDVADVFAVQGEIASAITSALRIRMLD